MPCQTEAAGVVEPAESQITRMGGDEMQETTTFDDRLGNDFDLIQRRMDLAQSRLNRMDELVTLLKSGTITGNEGGGILLGELLAQYAGEAYAHSDGVRLSVKSMRDNAHQRLKGMSHDLDESFLWIGKERQKMKEQIEQAE